MRQAKPIIHGRDHRPGGPDPIPFFGGSGPRIVFGCVYNDGGTDDVGSGDWSASWDSANGYTITVDPAFSGAIKVVLATPSNNNPPSGDPPQPYFVVANANVALLDTFYIYTYDMIGEPVDGGFAFAAIQDTA